MDNVERRKYVDRAVIEAEMLPVAMERFTASHLTPLEECLQQVRTCQVYIGILAHRYGSVPAGQRKSITELEYDAARQLGIPCFIFFATDNASLDPARDLDDEATRLEKQEKLAAFKARCSEDHTIGYFSEPAALEALVLRALGRLKQDGKV